MGGKLYKYYQKNDYGKIYGIDYSEQAVLDSIRANSKDVEAGKVNILQADVTDIPFPENHFDIITAFQTHYFWPDLENGVKEIFRILKQDGCFLITAETYKINYHKKSHKTKEELERLFKGTGFHSVKFYENTTKGWLCVKGLK